MPDSPNVLLISTDHWPGLLMGAAGHDRILTPTLDQLSANGVRFSQAYTATPTCIPARRALMTGTTAKTHGDRAFDEHLPMDPNLPTMPQVFRDAGYQAKAVGKLHVYPQRDRIGFDEVILCEEGRHHLGGDDDDFERFLKSAGYPGQELTHAMGNNTYDVRPWHLPEHCHPTNWTVREMCQQIQRRDPTRPAFWYCSFITPHPPVTPPRDYLDLYHRLGVDEPVVADWARDLDNLPYPLHRYRALTPQDPTSTMLARQGFYAQCSYIDHQIRLLIGQLREDGLLDDTIIMFVSDHGDMLGNHGLWAKPPMYEWSAKIPMILMPTAAYDRFGHHQTDDRLVELRDVMPTLLDLCGVDIPDTVEGMSLVGEQQREHLYCEHFEVAEMALRMIRAGNHKLIWYPCGNRLQLFDLESDPQEMRDLTADPSCAPVLERLTALLISKLYGSDLDWVENGKLVGAPAPNFEPQPNRRLSGQRGWR